MAVPAGEVERAVLEAVRDQLLVPEVIEAALEEAVRRTARRTSPDAATRLRKEIKDAQSELERLGNAVAAGGQLDTLVAAIAERETRINSLKAELATTAVAPQYLASPTQTPNMYARFGGLLRRAA